MKEKFIQAVTWMDLKGIMLSGKKKYIYIYIYIRVCVCVKHSQNGKSIEMENRLVVARVHRVGRWESWVWLTMKDSTMAEFCILAMVVVTQICAGDDKELHTDWININILILVLCNYYVTIGETGHTQSLQLPMNLELFPTKVNIKRRNKKK